MNSCSRLVVFLILIIIFILFFFIVFLLIRIETPFRFIQRVLVGFLAHFLITVTILCSVFVVVHFINKC